MWGAGAVKTTHIWQVAGSVKKPRAASRRSVTMTNDVALKVRAPHDRINIQRDLRDLSCRLFDCLQLGTSLDPGR
jgi:hypothetical protein